MSLVTTRDLTPTQRQALQQHRSFRASIRARAVPEATVTIQRSLIAPKPKAVILQAPVLPIIWPVIPEAIPEPAWLVPRAITIADIQDVVCATYRITKLALLGIRRDRPVLIPRHIAMYLARTLTPSSLPAIGRRFGNRDHSTVHNAVHKMSRLMKADENLAHEVALLIEKITGKQQ